MKQGVLEVLDMEWRRGKPPRQMLIYCTCNTKFLSHKFKSTARISCPTCGAHETVDALRAKWSNMPKAIALADYREAMGNLRAKLIEKLKTAKSQEEMKRLKAILEACIAETS